MVRPLFAFFISSLLIISCEQQELDSTDGGERSTTGTVSLSSEQLAFWDNIREHCGKAYQGILGDATEYYLPFDDSNVILHVFNCEEDLTHLALHISDNRSRNLLLTQSEGTLRLKHDHRYEDGREEDITQYGGDAPQPGLAHRQIFHADEHTANILPLRFDNFWFLDIMDESTLAYGVHWPKQGHSIRIEFDTTEEVEAPPAPWGYDSE
ncbi:MAG: hypothetical protein LAT84_00755 [Balneolia bacterium]|nr:hypothetical protein [Balneolia bacterium]